jgi:hypothetical protein
MQSLCVFCGSGSGTNPAYAEAARATGRTLAQRGIALVYGGGHVGLMGEVADAALAAGGQAIGVMPRHLVEREIAHQSLTRLDVVESMHARKARMGELADGFIALPGGAGTLEELFEQWTWAQLGSHAKPCALLNVAGYYNALLAQAHHMVNEGFMKRDYLDMLIVAPNIEEILAAIAAYRPPQKKWT